MFWQIFHIKKAIKNTKNDKNAHHYQYDNGSSILIYLNNTLWNNQGKLCRTTIVAIYRFWNIPPQNWNDERRNLTETKYFLPIRLCQYHWEKLLPWLQQVQIARITNKYQPLKLSKEYARILIITFSRFCVSPANFFFQMMPPL